VETNWVTRLSVCETRRHAEIQNKAAQGPGSSARDDIVFRGSPLVPPLFLPVALLAAGYLAAKRGPVGFVATTARVSWGWPS